MEKVNFAMISNWSSFAGDLITLDGSEMSIHLPVVNPAMVLWDNMIPFACGGGKKGLLITTISTDEDGLRSALPIGESISTELFP